MKFTCTKNNIASALSLVSTVAAKNINLPILNNVLLKATEQKVEIVVTNLELAIVVSVRAKIEQEGDFTVPAKTLSDFINLLPEETVEFSLVDNELQITCAKSSTKIKGMSAEDYPVIPSAEDGDGYLFNEADLKKGLSQVIPAAARNDIRPELSGLLFGFYPEKSKELVIAATDSYRLAEKKLKILQGEKGFRVIIPIRTAQEISHILSGNLEGEKENTVRVLLSESQIVVNYGSVQIISRLVDGQYPDYEQIIPKEFKTTGVFSISQMTKEIKAAGLFCSESVNGVEFKLSSEKGVVKVSSTSTQTGEYESEVTAQVDGEENSILLNHRYVLDGLNNLTGEEGVLKLINSDSPCLLSGNNNDYLYIVMPIRQ